MSNKIAYLMSINWAYEQIKAKAYKASYPVIGDDVTIIDAEPISDRSSAPPYKIFIEGPQAPASVVSLYKDAVIKSDRVHFVFPDTYAERNELVPYLSAMLKGILFVDGDGKVYKKSSPYTKEKEGNPFKLKISHYSIMGQVTDFEPRRIKGL